MDENPEITKRRKLKKLYALLCDLPFPPVPMPCFTPEFAEIDGLLAGFASSYSEGTEDEASDSQHLSDEEIIDNCEKSVEKALASYKPSSEKDKKAFEVFLAYKSLHNEIIENIKEIIKLKKRMRINQKMSKTKGKYVHGCELCKYWNIDTFSYNEWHCPVIGGVICETHCAEMPQHEGNRGYCKGTVKAVIKMLAEKNKPITINEIEKKCRCWKVEKTKKMKKNNKQ